MTPCNSAERLHAALVRALTVLRQGDELEARRIAAEALRHDDEPASKEDQ